MVYTENDLKKAIEDTRQMLMAEAANDISRGLGVIDELSSFTPDSFFQKVVEFTKKKMGFKKSELVHAGKNINQQGYCDVSDCWCRYEVNRD